MKTLLKIGFGVSLAVTVVGVSPGFSQDASTAEVRRAIDAGNAQYIDACAKGDPIEFAAVYDKDAARLEPGGVIVRGRSAIADEVRQMWKKIAGPLKVTAETQ